MNYSTIFFFLFIINLQAQSPVSVYAAGNHKDTLSETEFREAKDLYSKMSRTRLNAKLKNCMAELNAKLKDLKFAPDKINYNNEALTRKWLIENFDKTNLKSIDEGVNLIRQFIKLSNKDLRQNVKFYSLLSRGNERQRREILYEK